MVLFQDVCIYGLLFIQQKVNILENGSIRCGL